MGWEGKRMLLLSNPGLPARKSYWTKQDWQATPHPWCQSRHVNHNHHFHILMAGVFPGARFADGQCNLYALYGCAAASALRVPDKDG
jgi:hypothetical protein